MNFTRYQALRRLLLVSDALMLVACGALSMLAHDALRAVVPWLRHPTYSSYAVLTYLAVPIWLLAIPYFRMERIFEVRWKTWDLTLGMLKVQGLGLALLTVALFLTQMTLNRSIVLIYAGCSFLVLLLSRLVITGWAGHQFATGQGRARYLVLATPGPQLELLQASFARTPQGPLVVGYLGPPPRRSEPGEGPVRHLGEVARLDEVLHQEPVDWVLFLPPYHDPKRVPEALACCEALGVPAGFTVPWEPGAPMPKVETLSGNPFITFDWMGRKAEFLSLKHAVDTVASGLGLLVLSPLFLLIAAAVAVTMGRPLFFIQERIGLFGRRFDMFKFRTMVTGAEEQREALAELNEVGGPIFKSRVDPRVTRLGRLLRRTSLDELPQLVNVFLGSMSLVGPRPLPVEEQQRIVGDYRRRLSMKPGITGLWQVSGRSDVGFEETMAYDLEYVDGWTPWLDLQILLRTPWVVLVGRGAR